MATRRATRQTAGSGLGKSTNNQANENDLQHRSTTTTTTSLLVGKPALKQSSTTTTSKQVSSKIALASKSTNSNAAGAGLGNRKRTALGEVPNGASKAAAGATQRASTSSRKTDSASNHNQTTTSTASKNKAGSSNVATRRYGTRSSTGGSVKRDDDEDDDDEEDATSRRRRGGTHSRQHEQDDDEEEEDAMMLDDQPAPAPAQRMYAKPTVGSRGASTSTATGRAVKPLRKSATAPGASTSNNASRAPLGAKRANTTTSHHASTSQGILKKASSSNVVVGVPAKSRIGSTTSVGTATGGTVSVQARRLVKEKAEALRRATEELEEAKRVAALQEHKSKKARTTSEGEYFDHEEPEEEEDEDEEEGYGLDDEDVELRDLEEESEAKDAGWEDLDEGDEEDPLMVSSYVVEVYEYLRELELTTMPNPDYMLSHTEVTWKMRGILIDWLVEIHSKFRLLPETIFLATNIIDRLLSVQEVSLVKFQLVGITALFIAAKYEEVVCPSVSNFLYMTDGGYEDDEILRAERHVLAQLDFNLSYPNPINFLRRISKADGYDIQSRTMAKYLMEISIVDHRFLGCPPSLIAAAGSWLARRILAKGAWDANLVHYSGYSESELKPTAQLMLDYIVRGSSLAQPQQTKRENPLHPNVQVAEAEHPNMIKKYSSKKFFKAATQTRKWAETEFAPIEYLCPKTRKTIRQTIPAIL
ncbi:hypothetical protein T439DRAFT_199749 [Meredithblackwellia eburnea MCA 4105]